MSHGEATSEGAAAPCTVEAQGLGYAYRDRRALQDVSFRVERGRIFGLLGPNGGGKTTLFRILSTQLEVADGAARVMGFDVARAPAEVRRRIGVVFQSPSLDGKLTVAENLRYQGHLHGLRGAELARRGQEVLGRLGVEDRSGDRVETLSGGLARRVEVAKGLVHSPAVLLLDEPSTGLDPGARADLWRYLRELRGQGMTILVTTHLLEEADRCDLLLLLHRGRVVAHGSPLELTGEIGGDVLEVETDEPEALQREIGERFGVEVVLAGDRLHVESQDGHRLVTPLMEAFPDRIRAVRLSHPTLEDVFLRRTGQRYEVDLVENETHGA